jgi:16S rRNA (cytidine1402-2'-O)-methyltransferase
MNKEKSEKRGVLYIISTPLGNLEDVTLRTLRVLKEEIDIAFCEDTRVSRKFLSHYEINLPLYSYHEHNEKKMAQEGVKLLKEGKSIALLTDAGTPSISDPGMDLVFECHKNKIRVIPLPGPSSPITALSVSGFKSDAFVFLGFPPRKKQLEFWEKYKNFFGIIVVFESPKRIISTLKNVRKVMGNKDVFLAREMTKMHEEFIHADLDTLIGELEQRDKIYGEITFLLHNQDNFIQQTSRYLKINQLLSFLKEKNFSVKDVFFLLELFSIPKKEYRKKIYDFFKE